MDDIRKVIAEMRERRVNHGKYTSPTLEAWADRIEAALSRPADGEWVMVPRDLLDRFPEINPSNYDHDGVCTLNAWGVELVLAAATPPSAVNALEGWQIATNADGSVCVISPPDGPGGDIEIKFAGRLEQRLLHALSCAIAASREQGEW